MSELKRPPVLQLRHNNSEGFVYAYEVDEMDKYLSKLDGMSAELKADYKEACGRLQTANLIKDEQLDETRHQKYKRCLAMAKWCENALLGWMGYKESYSSHQRYIKVMLFTKWRKRWLELAEKFKEGK